VTGARVHENNFATSVVDQIPDATASGDLELPLRQDAALLTALTQVVLEPMLTLGRHAGGRFSPQDVPRSQRRAGCLGAQIHPALRGIVGAEDEIPLIWPGRRSDPVATFSAHLTPLAVTERERARGRRRPVAAW
jgi:hypothetical protein